MHSKLDENSTMKLKWKIALKIFIVTVGISLAMAVVYNSSVHDYYNNDPALLVSMILGYYIIAMSFLLFAAYPSLKKA